jgi:hypothetical protein
MKSVAIILGLALLLAGCGQSGVDDEAVQTALVVIAAERTREAQAASGAATPEEPSDAATVTSDAEIDQLEATGPHEDGVYLVGVDIAPGLWRSTATGQDFCYWARRKYDGVILASYYGLPGGEMSVDANDYEVELDGCGTWIYVGPS